MRRAEARGPFQPLWLSRADGEHLFPTPSSVASPWQLEVGQSGAIYTPRVGGCCPAGPVELLLEPAHHHLTPSALHR